MKILVTGFFDQLNAAQIKFLEKVSEWGDLYVGIGRDENFHLLRSRSPLFNEDDRLFSVRSLKCVEDAFFLDGRGGVDFEGALDTLKPDAFAVSSTADTAKKREVCEKREIDYLIVKDVKTPQGSLGGNFYFPYRVCLTGGWLDQPWVSQIHPGAVTVLNIAPDREFNFRSGMATSSRETAKRIWSTLPSGDPMNLGEILFGAENPPGTKYVSGSQDALGMCLPGLNKLNYDGGYWPSSVDSIKDREILDWIGSVFWMVPVQDRPDGYDPLIEKKITVSGVKALGESSELLWEAVQQKDLDGFSRSLSQTFNTWREIIPNTVPDYLKETVKEWESTGLGFSMSGCGGGYVIVVSKEKPSPDAFQISPRG